uniref:Uncharacterized protein n=1 Tax=Cacopsylla melanoneura TaxID=428564 RepID=A0A8D8SZ10_9HEMI
MYEYRYRSTVTCDYTCHRVVLCPPSHLLLKNPVPWFVYTYVKCMGRSTGTILVVFVIGCPAHQPLVRLKNPVPKVHLFSLFPLNRHYTGCLKKNEPLEVSQKLMKIEKICSEMIFIA